MIAGDQEAVARVPQQQVPVGVAGAEQADELAATGEQAIVLVDRKQRGGVGELDHPGEDGVTGSDEPGGNRLGDAEPTEEHVRGAGVPRARQALSLRGAAHDPRPGAGGDDRGRPKVVRVRVGDHHLLDVGEAETVLTEERGEGLE